MNALPPGDRFEDKADHASVTYGGLREPGNILAARVVTIEEEPRVIELRGDAAQKINRAYGTTGIITALEMPLAPAWTWIDIVVAFDDFAEAAAFGQEAALADGVVKKLISAVAAPLPTYFGALRPHCPDGKSIVMAMVAEPSLESFKALLNGRGSITLETPTDDGPGQVPLYEYSWNHTTLQVLKADRSVTYLQSLYPPDRLLEKVAEIRQLFAFPGTLTLSHETLGRVWYEIAESVHRAGVRKILFFNSQKRHSAAVMLISQADPGWDLSDSTRAPLRDPKTLAETDGQPDGFASFLTALRTEVEAFRKPVAYVHGDSHYFRIDQPFLNSAGQRLENFVRVETFGDNQGNGNNDVRWLKVTVDPRSRDVFSYQPVTVPANRTAVPAPTRY